MLIGRPRREDLALQSDGCIVQQAWGVSWALSIVALRALLRWRTLDLDFTTLEVDQQWRMFLKRMRKKIAGRK
jgi:hypothetical protein